MSIYGKTIGHKRGRRAVLTPAEEAQIVEWVTTLQRLGHPISLGQLRLKVAEICQT
jgi:hypothetical protein